MAPATRRASTGITAVLAMWLTVIAVVGSLLTARLFVWPHAPLPARADAVVVLSGDHGDRLGEGLALVRAGVAGTLVLDGEPDHALAAELCGSDQPFEVVCLRPEPDSTRAEAQAAGRLAAARGWRTLVVVTSRSHVTRAALLFRRCVTASVTVVGTDPPYGRREKVRAIRHEWLGLAGALLRDRKC